MSGIDEGMRDMVWVFCDFGNQLRAIMRTRGIALDRHQFKGVGEAKKCLAIVNLALSSPLNRLSTVRK